MIQSQGLRWKSLMEGQESLSFISESHSKSKKYNPPKKTKQTGLTPKIKSITQYILKASPNHRAQRQNQSSFVQSVRYNSKTKIEPPKKIFSELNSPSKLKKTLTITDQFGTSIPIIQKLRQISKQEKNQKKQNSSNFLFSSDQEHRYITGELFKIKQDYVKFKQLVLSQVIRLQKQMHQIVQQINNRLEDALSKKISQYPQTKIDQNIFKSYSPQISKSFSQDRSIKNIFKSINDTKNSFDKKFSKQSVKMQKAINKGFINKTVNFSSPAYQRYKEEEKIQKQKSQQNHLNYKRSQKMFQKLFSAVTFIKQQMRDISQLNRSFIDKQNFAYANKSTYDIKSQKKVKQMNQISQNQQNQVCLDKQVKKAQINDWIFRNRVKTIGNDS